MAYHRNYRRNRRPDPWQRRGFPGDHHAHNWAAWPTHAAFDTRFTQYQLTKHAREHYVRSDKYGVCNHSLGGSLGSCPWFTFGMAPGTNGEYNTDEPTKPQGVLMFNNAPVPTDDQRAMLLREHRVKLPAEWSRQLRLDMRDVPQRMGFVCTVCSDFDAAHGLEHKMVEVRDVKRHDQSKEHLWKSCNHIYGLRVTGGLINEYLRQWHNTHERSIFCMWERLCKLPTGQPVNPMPCNVAMNIHAADYLREIFYECIRAANHTPTYAELRSEDRAMVLNDQVEQLREGCRRLNGIVRYIKKSEEDDWSMVRVRVQDVYFALATLNSCMPGVEELYGGEVRRNDGEEFDYGEF